MAWELSWPVSHINNLLIALSRFCGKKGLTNVESTISFFWSIQRFFMRGLFITHIVNLIEV
jgi:hypothetical protein